MEEARRAERQRRRRRWWGAWGWSTISFSKYQWYYLYLKWQRFIKVVGGVGWSVFVLSQNISDIRVWKPLQMLRLSLSTFLTSLFCWTCVGKNWHKRWYRWPLGAREEPGKKEEVLEGSRRRWRAEQEEKCLEKWTQAVRLPGMGGGGGKLEGGPSSSSNISLAPFVYIPMD